MTKPSAAKARARADRTSAVRNENSPIERPVESRTNQLFGSDVVAQALRDLEIPYIALNPGASYRGLHDSLVNFLGNEQPAMLLCLHEEHAVAIAHGWAKITGRAMAVALHSNVGLFHGTMAIFNAWCDRMPVVILGATGPVDAVKRRPWIDWIHTARDQGAIVRNYTKWDDQPASPGAACEAMMRGAWIANTAPRGPVYINLDAGMQEARLDEPVTRMEPKRFAPPVADAAPAELVRKVAEMLGAAKRPLILCGRVSRSTEAWDKRVALAERFGAKVLTDLKTGASFPTEHELHAGTPGLRPTGPALEAIRQADVVLSLDWVDLAGTLKMASGEAPAAKVIQVSLDHQLHNGWSMDYQGLPPVDVFLSCEPDTAVAAMLDAGHKAAAKGRFGSTRWPIGKVGSGPIPLDTLAHALRGAVGERDVTLLHLPLSWNAATWPLRHPLDYIGSNGGGGVGGGPGISVGAALALKGSGRLPVAVVGDGDFLMGLTSVWTAAHYKIPLLFVVANNQSFYNDEVHQERVAKARGRPVENKWIGLRMSEPDIDLAALGRAQGAQAWGPVSEASELEPTFAKAIAAVDAGGVAVVDVRIVMEDAEDQLASPGSGR